jgi:hypothetical protein
MLIKNCNIKTMFCGKYSCISTVLKHPDPNTAGFIDLHGRISIKFNFGDDGRAQGGFAGLKTGFLNRAAFRHH